MCHGSSPKNQGGKLLHLSFIVSKAFVAQIIYILFCSVKMAEYWARSFFASLWTSIPSRSINTPEKILANIQPCGPLVDLLSHLVSNPYLLINRSETEIISFSIKYHYTKH